jgi:hypothetical protein
LAHLVILHKCLESLCGLQMAASSALNWWKVCGCKSAWAERILGHTRILSAQVLFFRKIDHFKELLHAIPETPSTFSQCELACTLWDLPEKRLTCKNSKTKGLGFTKLSQHKLSTMMPMNTTWQESLVPRHKPWMLAKA